MDLIIFMFTHSRLGIYIYTTFIFTNFHQNAKKNWNFSDDDNWNWGLCELGIKSISDCHSNNYGPWIT